MQYIVQNRRNLATFELKQQYIHLLASELEDCGFDMVLKFEASSKNRICTLKFTSRKRIVACINLEYAKKSVCIGDSSELFKVRYCVLFLAAYIKQIERAIDSVPQSYFEGLVFLNAIEVYKSEKLVNVYSPLAHWDERLKRSCCLRPFEISSAIIALNKIRVSFWSTLSEEDRRIVNTFYNQLLLYASLPEISHVYASVPVYALIDGCKKIALLINREPKLSQEFPTLALAPFGQIGQLTVNELLLHCIQSDSEFLIGVAVRLAAFLLPSQDVTITDGMHQKLISAMGQYIDSSAAYYNEDPKASRGILFENLFAVRAITKAINEFLVMQEIDVNSGNIHFIV